MRRLVLAVLLCACGGSEPVEADPVPEEGPTDEAEVAEPGSSEPWAPDPAEQKVIAALSARQPEPRCADLEPLVDDPVATWRGILEHVPEPPFASLRAATCLVTGHPRAAEEDALRWVADPEATSLTTLVLGRLDGMPLDGARRIAEAALAGPHEELARTRIARLRSPELRALVAPAEASP